MTGFAAVAAIAAVAVAMQPPAPSWLKPATRVSAEASLEARRKDAPPGTHVLAVDVVPAPGIHVYAPGNEDYIAVALTILPQPGVTPGTAQYPPPEPLVFGELKEVVQVYGKPFRIRLPVVLKAGAGRPRQLAATLRYQACTDRVCYPPATIPLAVAVPPAR